MVATEAHTAYKRAVLIILECLPVSPVLDYFPVVVHECGPDAGVVAQVVGDLGHAMFLPAAPRLTHAAGYVARAEGSRPVHVHRPHPGPPLPRRVQLLT